VERTCPFSAKRLYVDAKMWQFYAFTDLEGRENVTDEMRLRSLATDNPYGRCVWRCDNDVVDRQSVAVEFANGSVASHEMICTASRPCRKMHIIGTLGEIEGTIEEGRFVVRHMNPAVEVGYDEKAIDLNVSADMHGGGDLELVKDFVSAIAGEPTSLATTRIEDSLTGHQIAYAAEEARTQRKVVEFGGAS